MMFSKQYYLLCLLYIFSCGCNAQKNNSTGTNEHPDDIAIAFPGAEGYGKYTNGGRGGKIHIISNLNDDGPGSFREACETKNKRIIIFAISGTIHLLSPLRIGGNVTIAGQTAPGDGICLADQPVTLGGDNIIIRFLRFRMGDKFQRQKGMVDGSGSDDALGGIGRKNIIIDHCSISWSTDEAFTVYNGDSTTLQWNIISEPLNYSYHFEQGDKDFEHHGYGGIWGGRNLSAHHNLFAHCVSRNPRFAGIRSISSEFVDFRNNVIYNWGHNTIYGGEGGNYNLINNYYKYGPSTKNGVRNRIVNPSRQVSPAIGFGKYFVHGNFVDGAPDVSTNNWLGIDMDNGGTEADKKQAIIEQMFPGEKVVIQDAKSAYELVLQKGGASLPKRDSVDQRVINDVHNRTGRIIDVQGGYPHGTPYELTQNAWPVLRTLPPLADSDKDGMPDEWERKNGLNLSDPTDGSGHTMHTFYSNVEMYLNSLVKWVL